MLSTQVASVGSRPCSSCDCCRTCTGVAAALTTPLAAAGISVLPAATYDTDYLFVRDEALARAVAALEGAGHIVA